jgi:tRNA (guanine37-N1)-methyltransferase
MPLRIDFVTLFPEMVLHAMRQSMLKRAEEAELTRYHAVDPREFTTDNHRTVDDKPYGGGPGMVMKPEPVAQAIRSLDLEEGTAVVLPDPTGLLFRQEDAAKLAATPRIVFVCGHYEGIDHRIVERFVTHRFSIGDYVLTGGELPALVMADAIVRLVPGVLGCGQSLEIDSHQGGLLSAPQYTKPQNWEGMEVPEVLRSGDHGAVERWKRQIALKITREQRPDLFCRAKLEKTDLDLLSS